MAAMLKQPWPPFLLPHLTLIFLSSILLLFPNHSFSQSDSPRNIETFFPNDTFSAPVPSPVTPTPQNPSSSSSSDRANIIRAVLITAASTLLVAAVFFFFVQKWRRRRQRRDRVGVENTLPPPLPPLAETTLAREGFTRFGGNVKGLILDENGLDVLYWRKSQSQRRNKSGSFRKEIVHGGDDDEEKNVIYSKNKKKSGPVTEIPLLRGRSSTSHSVIHNDNYQNATTNTTTTPLHVKSESFEFANSDPSPPPPPPIPVTAPAPPPPPPKPKTGPSPPPPPPPKPKTGPSPPPPPPLKKSAALASSSSKPPPAPRGSSSGEGSSGGNGQVKLKPLHWDKVNPDSDHSMVWDKIDRGSFSFDGDLMEALFGYVAVGKKSPDHGGDKGPSSNSPAQIFILDPRKSQNTAIVLKSLGMTRDELVESLMEGHDFHPDTLERLSRIAPTKEEQSAILQFDGDTKMLADAESFLFHLLKAVPCAFTRLNALLFRANYYPEISNHKKSLQTLDLACTELRSRGLFVKLLEAILKSGNRMNAGTARGDAQAFNLTALLKLSDVKSVDGKTTLLNFVVEEVVRSEGKRCVINRRSGSFNRSSSSSISEVISKEEQEKEYLRLGLPVVGGLSAEFSNVKKAAAIDYDTVSATSLALTSRAKDARRVLAQSEGDNKEGERFVKKMNEFLDSVEEEVKQAREQEKKVMELVKRTTEYYQAGAIKGKNPLHLFVIVRDFLGMVDKVCVEIARNLQRRTTTMGSPQQRNAVKFPVLPPNFMSDRSRTDSGGSDSDM
ncbi:Formin-like protein 4 [Cardamine amara subsp. amara]|uniref:Formin-like protein n=1 Tax=Cardamine amara subsp. amara TaxID=228776 RepID=A0ABD1BP52_CARAN